MIDKELVSKCIDNFNMRLDMTNNEINKDEGSFDFSIANLRESRFCISVLQDIINEMKQEEHNFTQDVYNKFKNKNFVKSIIFK